MLICIYIRYAETDDFRLSITGKVYEKSKKLQTEKGRARARKPTEAICRITDNGSEVVYVDFYRKSWNPGSVT